MFNLVKIEGGRINVHEPEMHTVGDAALAIGTVCRLSDGKLEPATGTTKPTHITLAGGASGAVIPTGRIEPNQVYETTIVASGESLALPKVGENVTVGSDGKNVTDTKNGGVATIVSLLEAAASGDIIHVRF